MSRHEVSWTCLIEDRGQFISWDSVHGRRCTHLYYVKVLSMHEWLWMPKDVGFHMMTRQRWAAPPLCNEPSECWRPWHRQISGQISGPALGETTSDISLPKCKELVHYGSFTIIYKLIPSYENILNTALTGPKYVEIPHSTRLSGECLILGRDYSELVHFTPEFSPCLRKPKSCQGDPETLPDYQVL